MSKPQPELLRKNLIKALRSGKYHQICGSLRAKSSNLKTRTEHHYYCGIGLAYQLLSGDWTKDDAEIWNTVEREYLIDTDLLAELNDEKGNSFEQLADKIEAGELDKSLNLAEL